LYPIRKFQAGARTLEVSLLILKEIVAPTSDVDVISRKSHLEELRLGGFKLFEHLSIDEVASGLVQGLLSGVVCVPDLLPSCPQFVD
jgi:hypothetical protein